MTGHEFHIFGTEIGDSANYDPRNQALLYDKGKRDFLVNCRDSTVGITIPLPANGTATARYRMCVGTTHHAEQVHPHPGEPLSVSPLTWSHASLALATLEYLEQYR